MRRLIVYDSVTLDGVMQGPGHPDEDRRDGFRHGGWAAPYADQVMMEDAGAGMAGESAMLFGRVTYEDLAAAWSQQGDDNPFAKSLNRATKYVVSRTLQEPLAWKGSRLVTGDVPAAVKRLKTEDGPDVVILGSGELIRSLLPHGLIDEIHLLIHPLVLGSGRRLFEGEGALAHFELADSKASTTGVILATYRPASGPPKPGSQGTP
jgi:dihydrofolate reductase